MNIHKRVTLEILNEYLEDLKAIPKPVEEGYFTRNRKYVPMREMLLTMIKVHTSSNNIFKHYPHLTPKIDGVVQDSKEILRKAVEVLDYMYEIFNLTPITDGYDLSNINVNDKIMFDNEKLWYTVQAIGGQYLVCNATLKNDYVFTIYDMDKKIRGSDNKVFHSGYSNKEECEMRLYELLHEDLEISMRNRAPCEVIRIKR